MLSNNQYSILEDHTKNLTMLCGSISKLSQKNLCTKEILEEFSERMVIHVKAILENAKGIPEEDLFTNFCLSITPLGEGPEYFQKYSSKILEYYNIRLRHIWRERHQNK